MNGHRVFQTPWRLVIMVIMMIIGLNYLLQDLLLAALVGMSVYAAAAWIEQLINRE